MSLFEDPKMDYYREWDRQYDARMEQAEDARMLAYEKKAPPIPPAKENASAPHREAPTSSKQKGTPSLDNPPPPSLRDMPPEKGLRRKEHEPDILVFHFPDGERALSAVKKAVRDNHALSYASKRLEDGTYC